MKHHLFAIFLYLLFLSPFLHNYFLRFLKFQSCIAPKENFQENQKNKISPKDNIACNEKQNLRIISPRNLSNLKIPTTGRGLLIVTLKCHVEEWAEHIRNLPEPRLYLYTDTLAKRRKFGAYNLAQYDVVITTFDVSKSKIIVFSHSFYF